MKMMVDGVQVLELSPTQKKVICNDIEASKVDEDMKRRAAWVWQKKFDACMDRLKKEWLPKLKGRVENIPLDDEKLAELIFSQPDYMDREAREEQGRAQLKKLEANL